MCEADIMLGRVIRALMAYYGPVAMIQATIEESDRVIAEMAENGFMKEAKNFAAIMGAVRKSMGGDPREGVQLATRDGIPSPAFDKGASYG